MKEKLSELISVLDTPDRRKTEQLCHINMLKAYHERPSDDSVIPVATIVSKTEPPAPSPSLSQDNTVDNRDLEKEKKVGVSNRLNNTEVLQNLSERLTHLDDSQQVELGYLIQDDFDIFPDVPRRTTAAVHDIDVGEEKPIKQHPYWVNPLKLHNIHTELEYMIQHDIISPSQSSWSSPCLGDFAGPIHEALNDFDIPTAVVVMGMFLQQYDPEDAAGQYYRNWPEVQQQAEAA